MGEFNHLGQTYIRFKTNIPGVDLDKVKSSEWMSLGLGINHFG